MKARDRQGRPVHNLKREDFRLYEDGKERSILSVDEVRPETSESLAQADSAHERDRPGKIVLLFFDDGTLTSARLAITRELAAGFVRRSMHPGDLFGVASHGLSLKLLQPFTRDMQEVLQAIQQPSVSHSRNPRAAKMSDGHS